MSDKPSYLGLLNAIAVAEGQAGRYLTAWADTTDDDQVREVLRFVALRESEHSLAFEKRVVELGYTLRPGDETELQYKMELATSDRSDREKFEAFGIGRPIDGNDVFTNMFANPDLDPVTGGLLGRYIAEERDSGRRLNACCEALSKPRRSRAKPATAKASKSAKPAGKTTAKATKSAKPAGKTAARSPRSGAQGGRARQPAARRP
jgi:hypothetical protein